MTKPLIELRHCDVFLNAQPVLHDVSWQLQRGENWAFWGANGSGKSTLLKLTRGEIWPHFARGSRAYRFDHIETSSPIRARENIAFIEAAQLGYVEMVDLLLKLGATVYDYEIAEAIEYGREYGNVKEETSRQIFAVLQKHGIGFEGE